MFINPVKCQKCNKEVATVKITKIINGEVHEMNLCQDCAAELSPYQKKMSMLQQDLDKILAGLLSQEQAGAIQPVEQEKGSEPVDMVCDVCGLPFETYRKSYFLGCSHCYKAFREHLIPDIRKVHGSLQHKGRVPGRYKKIMQIKQNLENLKKDLKVAVDSENFELAAKLRDEIQSISSEGDLD